MELTWAIIARRVTTAALVAAPLLAVVAIIAMLWSPHEFAESDTASGASLWLGAAFGLAVVLVVYALPQLAFGLALRSRRPRWLRFTAVASPLLAVFCLVPFLGALVNGWNGVSPVAVVTVACAGVLDSFVFVVALRQLRHRHDPPRQAVTPHGNQSHTPTEDPSRVSAARARADDCLSDSGMEPRSGPNTRHLTQSWPR